MVVQAALPAALLAEPALRAGVELARQRVIGWERVETYTKGRKRPHVVTERSAFELQAWELAAIGLVGVAAYVVYGGIPSLGIPGGSPVTRSLQPQAPWANTTVDAYNVVRVVFPFFPPLP